jgi:hypothetical protein
MNTAHFHAIDNHTRRNKMINVLDGPEGPVNVTKDVLKVASNFYKDLLGWEAKADIHKSDDFFSPSEKITISENESLEKIFRNNEIRRRSLDPMLMGHLVLMVFLHLYQNFWDIIKEYLIEMFNE